MYRRNTYHSTYCLYVYTNIRTPNTVYINRTVCWTAIMETVALYLLLGGLSTLSTAQLGKAMYSAMPLIMPHLDTWGTFEFTP